MSIPTLPVGIPITLDKCGSWKASKHVFDKRSANAIRAAIAAGRPLLIRGEPGAGKSQLARAAAQHFGWPFLSEVVNTHTEIQDLWYRFDAVSRLGHAQVLSFSGKDKTADELKQELKSDQYLSPGILWWAYDWNRAQQHECEYPMYLPDQQQREIQNPQGVVLLIDEIDKADSDLPNSLLETLDNGKFQVPWQDEAIGANRAYAKPLVIITTNEDRPLPAAFIRRCLVLELSLPEEEAALQLFLVKRGEDHFKNMNKKVREEAARLLIRDRQAMKNEGQVPPGQAEYLDMLAILNALSQDKDDQLHNLKLIAEFNLRKHPSDNTVQTRSHDEDLRGEAEAG